MGINDLFMDVDSKSLYGSRELHLSLRNMFQERLMERGGKNIDFRVDYSVTAVFVSYRKKTIPPGATIVTKITHRARKIPAEDCRISPISSGAAIAPSFKCAFVQPFPRERIRVG
jgi:hypothetical protein